MLFSFPNKAEFGEITQPNLEQYGGRLILYGAGKVADVVDYVLRQRGIKYLCYCDTYRAGGTHNGHPIVPPEALRGEYAGVPVIITTIHHRSVMELLQEYGPREIMDSVPLLVDVDFSDWGKSGEKMTAEWASRLVLSYLTTMVTEKNTIFYSELCVMLTQKCTLRCKDCSSLIPYFQNPIHYDADMIVRSLSNLLSYEEIQFQEIPLLGGEPLLYPDLFKVLAFALTAKSARRVSIITNGTLVPREELIPLMQDSRFFMRISDYGALSSQKDKLLTFLENNKIRYEIDNYTEWYENQLTDSTACNEADASYKYHACTDARYAVLQGGRLYRCSKVSWMVALGIAEPDEDNSIELLEEKGLHNRIRLGLQHFAECEHLDICHRCYGLPHIHPDRMVKPALQAEGLLKL